MCGISGIVSPDNSRRKGVMQMIDSMNHRGPDYQDIWEGELCTLGHNRLAIIDLDSSSNQPMISHNERYVLVFNGEIYNYQELKKELKRDWKTQSDTEIILEAFTEWGPSCLQKFNGMFALAIWDKINKVLFIARDRLGIKPFYYAAEKDVFLFASELRAILKTKQVNEEINPTSIESFLKYQWVQSPDTIVKNIKQLGPGTYGLWKNGTLTVETWWNIESIQADEAMDYEKAKSAVRKKFNAAVDRRLISDVPIGAFLSGGIDSSAVVAAMSKSSNKGVKTFSIGFEEKEFDESEHAEEVAQLYGTDHQTLIYKPENLQKEIPTILKSFDTPSSDGVNSYIISSLVKRAGITVALSGLGGDELFCGYPVYKQLPKLLKKQAFWSLPKFMRKTVAASISVVMNIHPKWVQMIGSADGKIESLYPYFRMINDDKTIKRIINIPRKEKSKILLTKPELTLSWISEQEIQGYTQNVLLKDSDMCSMAHSLELRVPFFDHELVELALSLPDSIKNPITPKKLLIDALEDELPKSIVNRKKMGFAFPWDKWLRDDLREFVELNLGYAKNFTIFNQTEVKKLWSNFLARKNRVHWSQVWNLVCLLNWMNLNLESVVKD